MKLAAFVTTFERPEILRNTIAIIFRQTLTPEKLLIVDNSQSDRTTELVKAVFKDDPRIVHHRMGYNSGPAGGAHYGLKTLAEQGYEFVQWYDDDDPPLFNDITERLFEMFNENNVAVVGQAGAKFSKMSGKLSRYSDSTIKNSQYLEVDYIGGNQLMIVKAHVIMKGCLPDKDLFFGFEDLSFCLKVRSLGYRILIDSALLMRLRTKVHRTGHVSLNGEPSWRDYYSIRSLIYICLYEQKIFSPFVFILPKVLAAIFIRSKFRLLPIRGLVHGLLAIKGIVISPEKKTQ